MIALRRGASAVVSSSSASASASVSPTPSRSRAASPAPAARAAPATATAPVVPPTATVAGDAPPVKHLPTESTQAQAQERRVRILEGDAVVHVAAARTRGRARAVPEADASKPLGSRARSPSPTTSELTSLNTHVPSVDTDHVVSEYSLQPHSHSHSSVQRASSPPPTVAERRSKTTEARVSATRPDTRAISPTRHATSVRVSANASAGTSAEVKGSSSASGRKSSSSSSSSSRQRHVRLDGGAAGVDVSGGRRTRASRKPKATVSTSKVLLQAPRPSSSSSSSSSTVRAAGDVARGVTKRAVLIGINYTTSASLQLFGCVNDAVNMRTLLVNCFGFSESNITLMTDDAKVTTNPLHIPTAANILRELQNLTTGLVAGDLAVLHYSGHGLRYTDTSRDEADGRDEAILSKDSKAILDDVLRVLVDRAAATGVRLRMFFDSCHSGTVLDLPYYLSDSGSAVRNTGAALATNALANVVMISGSRDTQYSMDTYLENQPQGAMSCLLQTVLETTAHGMSTTGAVYKWSDVLIALRATLTQMGYSQVPQLSFTQLSMCTSVMDL